MDESHYTLSNLERRWSVKDLREQFILCRDRRQIPEGWHVDSLGEWHLGHHPSLPVLRLATPDESPAGWLLGYAIDGAGTPVTSGPVRIPSSTGPTSRAELEDWIYSHGGRFLVVVLTGGNPRVYLDPAGSLSAVYCPELAVVASTVSVVPRQGDTGDLTEMARATGIPLRNAMYPMVITPRKNVWRILPNHFLNLTRWECTRHWPTTEIVRSDDIASPLDRITKVVRRQIGAMVARGPVLLRLTAGHDSRMLLACARPWADRITIFTAEHEYPDETAWVDCRTAGRIARDLRLRYRHLRFLRPRPADLEQWVYKTGASVCEYRGWRACTTYRQLPAGHADLLGSISDILRKVWFSKKGDDYETRLSPERLLTVCNSGDHPLGRQVMSNWLDAAPALDAFLMLDLFYVEQRLSCWAGIFPYAYNHDGRFQIFPLNHRDVILGIMAIPVAQRNGPVYQKQFIEREWPELLRYPFNEPRGIQKLGLACYRARGRLRSMASRVKRAIFPPKAA